MTDWKDSECNPCGCGEGTFCNYDYCAPACNTFWTSIACGYFCPDKCPAGEWCFDDNDCASNDCTGNVCQ